MTALRDDGDDVDDSDDGDDVLHGEQKSMR